MENTIWKKIPTNIGGTAIDQLIEKFSAKGFEKPTETDVITEKSSLKLEHHPGSNHDTAQKTETHGNFAAYIDRLTEALSRISKGQSKQTADSQTKHENIIADAAQAYNSLEKCGDPRSALALGYLADWAVSMLKNNMEMLSVEEHAAALHLINRFQKSASVRDLLPSKTSKGRLGEIAADFLVHVATDCGLGAPSSVELIQDLSNNIDKVKARQSLFVVAFSPAEMNDSLTAKSLWDSYSGEPRQAEARAALMNILWQCSVPTALACCLKYSPIEIESRTADALANIADQALSKGRVDLLQSFVDLKRTVNAKPFQLFVDLLLSKMPTHADQPAEICFVRPLLRSTDQNKLDGTLSIKPRRVDSPDLITLRLPNTSPVLFDGGVAYKEFKGPFINEESFLQVSFQLRDKSAHHFTVPIDGEAKSITGFISTFSIRLEFQIAGEDSFQKIPPEEIEEAFQQFPAGRVFGSDYIHRPDDERRIEQDLFDSKIIRSLWICSPRRSGKTTMLYRILDAYSHKNGRENLVIYFSLNKPFDSTTVFNEWIWKSIKNLPENKELRDLFVNFSEIGRDLPYDADVGTFIENLANRLIASAKLSVTRTVFLFDEIDKLATMYFEGGIRKDTSMEIAWQLRQLIGRSRDIGFVFAGSSAAKRIFLTNHEAPFYNSGILFELSQFSCNSPKKEKLARAIIEPPRIQGRLKFDRDSLERMLWICSGIPYYIKLLAGATYAVAKQHKVLISDVDEALHALLEKRTGISRLDRNDDDSGTDELWTIALEKGADLWLTKGVLYAVAEMESALSGYPIRRAQLYNESSPLVTRYQLPSSLSDFSD